jgi:hydroxyacylglutathione hydrolase
MTLVGTRTYAVGVRRVVVIDPGPADGAHLEGIVADVAPGEIVAILLTHMHPDHEAGAGALSRATRAPTLSRAAGTLEAGQRIPTDAGDLVAVPTPGHTPDHTAFHWPVQAAVFCGDLLMGGLDTALVASPEGDLADYLASLERLRSLAPRIVYPTHGPAFTEPDAAIGRYIAHRREREAQVLVAIDAGAASAADIVDHVYGVSLDPALRSAAEAAVQAYISHLCRTGRLDADPAGRLWRSDGH